MSSSQHQKRSRPQGRIAGGVISLCAGWNTDAELADWNRRASKSRSPADLPPNWKASDEVMKILGPTEFLSSTHHGHLFFSPAKLEQLLDAVWRSALQ